MRLVAETARAHGVDSLHLEGGTALSAYFLGHRESEDLDFFANPDFDARSFLDLLTPVLAGEFIVERTQPSNRSHARALATDSATGTPVKLDVAASSSFRIAPREPTTEGIEVASYRDLCAGKLHAICDRFEVRDFIDLDAILHRPASSGSAPDDAEMRDRAKTMIRDLMETDPGLDLVSIGSAAARGVNQPLATRFPLRILRPVEEARIQRSISLVLETCIVLTRTAFP